MKGPRGEGQGFLELTLWSVPPGGLGACLGHMESWRWEGVRVHAPLHLLGEAFP